MRPGGAARLPPMFFCSCAGWPGAWRKGGSSCGREGRSLEEAGLRQRFVEEADRPLKGDDLAAKALHKGCQALLAWAAEEAERASALLREAVGLRPQLAGGLALRLAERLWLPERASLRGLGGLLGFGGYTPTPSRGRGGRRGVTPRG